MTLPTGFITQLADSESVDDVLRAAAQWMPAICQAEYVSVATPGGLFSLRVQTATEGQRLSSGALEPIDGSIAGEVFRLQQIVRHEDLRATLEEWEPRRPPQLSSPLSWTRINGWRASIGAPALTN